MSSTHSYRAPLIRRILPWVYVAIFCITAPLLVFYTSGYRYNFKKGAVERNGTLIVDSTPNGGVVFIDGRDTGEKTPVTFQQIPPGWHSVQVSKPGYGTWQQEILVRAERVAFTDHIRLWRQGEPTLISAGPYVRLASDPTRERLLAFQSTASSTSVGWWSATQQANTIPLPREHASAPLRWRTDGEAVLIGGTRDMPSSWYVQAARARTTVEALPNGTYHWSGNELIGFQGRSQLSVDVARAQIERTTLPTGIEERSGSIELRVATSSNQLLLADSSFLGRLFSLPNGRWSIHDWHRPYLFLSDGIHWLGIRLRLGVLPTAMRAEGDYPRWSPDTDNPRAAFVNEHEIRLWNPETPETVVWRQSTPIRNAVWNDDGGVLYVADAQSVFALPLDNGQDPRPVQLGVFDEVWDVAVQGTTIFAVGKRGDQQGIFRLPGI